MVICLYVAIVWTVSVIVGAVCLNEATKMTETPKEPRPTLETSKIGAGTRQKKGRFAIPKNSGKRISSPKDKK